jgi:hypothetical protein
MTLLVFVLLAVLWGAVFIPAIVRARLDSSPIATVGMFRRGMNALSASGPRVFSGGRWILIPPTTEQLVQARKQALARHRQHLAWLLLAAATTLLLGVLPGLHVLLKVHVLVDLAFVGYLVFLVQTKQRRLEQARETATTSIPARRPERIIDLSDDLPAEPLRVFEEDDEPRYLKAGHF